MERQIEKTMRRYKPHSPAELAVEFAKEICNSPFTDDIVKTKKTAKFAQPKFKLFEGMADLIKHIYHFVANGPRKRRRRVVMQTIPI